MSSNHISYSPRTDPSQLAKALFDELTRRYREDRQLRVAAEKSRILERYRPGEAESLLTLALNWAPYGGVPEEEVFEQYGTTLTGFVDQLWAIVRHLHCDHKTVAKLSAVYPKQRTSSPLQVTDEEPTEPDS
ncbi:hypothetical protein [Rhodococcus qingshengii]|uniref:hypothetical protein n=1 Tax=Rhodococcus qingshengii TaxID=334542 RepID=UPI003602ABF9